MLHASLGQRDRIDPRVFRFKPEETVDGDIAESDWFLARVVSERQEALVWFRRASSG